MDKHEILDLCRHLVVLNEVSDSFELAHLSVREYLEGHDEYKNGHSHAVVAKRCIELFDSKVPRGILDQYASLYWVEHYNNRPQTGEDVLTDDVEKKLFHNKGVNPAFEKWAELAEDSISSLVWFGNLAKKLRDTRYEPLAVVCVFGL